LKTLELDYAKDAAHIWVNYVDASQLAFKRTSFINWAVIGSNFFICVTVSSVIAIDFIFY